MTATARVLVNIDAALSFIGATHPRPVAFAVLAAISPKGTPKEAMHVKHCFLNLQHHDWHLTAKRFIIERATATQNLYIAVADYRAATSRTEQNVLGLPSLYSEEDDHPLCPDLPPATRCVETSAGRFQSYWSLTAPMDVPTAKRHLAAIADASGFGHQAIDAARLLRLPGTPNYNRDGFIVQVMEEHPERVYDLTAFAPVVQAAEADTPSPTVLGVMGIAGNPDGLQAGRGALTDDELLALARSSKNAGKFTALWMGDSSGYRSPSEADLALCALIAFFAGPDPVRIDRLFRRSMLMRPKWDERHGTETYGAMTITRALAGRTDYWQPGTRHVGFGEGRDVPGQEADGGAGDPRAWTSPANPWPEPLAKEAFHGIAGSIVHALEPHSEADPAALLVTLLIAVGNAIGRSPYFEVEADRHRLNLNIVTVGETAGGRKGVALNRILSVMETVDPDWASRRVLGGLSSGEGLIWAVRDAIYRFEHDKKTGTTSEVMIDPGVADKRLLVPETEFANVLRQFQRDGNTLSNIMRDAWDGKSLAAMTKNSPARATDPHISIIGHITVNELLRYLDTTEAANGLGNRYMWPCTRRSKFLPDGGEMVDLTPLTDLLRDRVIEARKIGRMTRGEEARAVWHAVYRPLTEGQPGLLGAMIARAAPTVVRLSMIYALLDGTSVIGVNHLKAALAVWDYAEASARYIFGDALGDPTADEILRALRAAPGGLTRTDIYAGLFGRNQSAARIGRALADLLQKGLARCEREDTGGRPGERWFATSEER